MSVKLIDNTAFYGYRVRRTVDGKLYQEYMTLIKSGKRMGPVLNNRVKKIATARDEELEAMQIKSKKDRLSERCFHSDGSIKGISFLVKKEKSGMLTPIFQVGIASVKLNGEIICTSCSINAHGVDEAWKRSVETYAFHKEICEKTKLFKKIKASMPKVDLTEVNKAREKVEKRQKAQKNKRLKEKAVAKKVKKK